MNKKVKKFFRRTKDSETFSTSDICNMNVVSEAERIVEEYVNKMGYRFKDEPSPKKHPVLLIISAITVSALVFAAVKMFWV